MTMLISKFHRLIQSKIMWWSILSIIVLTFVVWGTATPNAQKTNAEATSPGKLNGQPVSRQEFQSAYFNSYLSVILAMGRAFNITPEIDTQLRQAAWQRMVSLDEAAKLGLSATDDEIASSIQQNQAFLSQEGQFYKPAYKAFVEQFLRNFGFTEKQFEEHVRQEIVLQKMRVVLNRATLVPPRDIQRTFSSISDKFRIEYAILGPDLVTNTVQLSQADIKAYFEKDPAAFTVPEKMKVKYVRFAAAPFVAKAHIAPEDAQEYYNDHLDEFLAPTNEIVEVEKTDAVPADTNAVAATAADTNDVASTADVGAADTKAFVLDTNALTADANVLVTARYKPFEDVKQEISNLLIHEKAMDLAADRAMEFVMDLTPDRDGKVMSFNDAAKKHETLVERPEPFTQREKIPDTDAGLEINRAAFALGADESMAVSEPIRGEEFVYVVGFDERLASRVPNFDEVAGDVFPFAQAQSISDALGGRAKEIHDAALKAAAEGKTFASAVEPFGVNVITSGQFTASVGPTTNDYSDLLMRGVMTMNQGEVSELLPANDAILIAYVVERTPGDPTTYDSLKQQIETTLRRQNGRYVFDSWQEYLIKQAKLEEKKLEIPEDEPVEDSADHNT